MKRSGRILEENQKNAYALSLVFFNAFPKDCVAENIPELSGRLVGNQRRTLKSRLPVGTKTNTSYNGKLCDILEKKDMNQMGIIFFSKSDAKTGNITGVSPTFFRPDSTE